MKICVFGAGAVGGNFAYRLARAGADVSVVARGAHLASIRERGITVTSQGETQSVPVRATDDAHSLGPQDVVIVTLKAVSIAASAGAIASLCGPDTLVVFAVNGLPWWYRPREGGALDMLDPGGTIAAHVPRGQVIGGVIHVTATIREPGHVVLEGGLNALLLGEPDGGPATRAEPLGGAAARRRRALENDGEHRRGNLAQARHEPGLQPACLADRCWLEQAFCRSRHRRRRADIACRVGIHRRGRGV